MIFRLILLISLFSIELSASPVFAYYDSDKVRTENHFSNIEFYEFSNLSELGNVLIFFNAKAEKVRLKCTLFGRKKLKVTVIEEEKYKYQYIEMSDCQTQLRAVVTRMIENPLEKKFKISYDYEDEISKEIYYKFEFLDLGSFKDKTNYIQRKLKTTLDYLIL